MDVINRIIGLLGTDSDSADTDPTSMRIPSPLREAAKLAHEHLGAPSATAMAVAGLRETIETAVIRAALDDHYAEHPSARPSLGEVAVALAGQDRHPLADDPDRILQAAKDAGARVQTAREVLIWAEAYARAAVRSA